MVNILVSGCNGKMGQAIVAAVSERGDANIVCGIDTYDGIKNEFPVYQKFSEVLEKPDVIIDFSNPSVLNDLLQYAIENAVPCVLCTTGYSDEQIDAVNKSAERIAVFRSGNMSLGINLLIEISKMAAKVFGKEFDIEIVEKHHHRKIDAPSGTALMIADEISTVMEDEPTYVYDRHSVRKKRDPKEIGIHSVRGGSIVGEHDVIFAGDNEVVTISHQAQSRSLFAVGAVNAAVFLADKKTGNYDMSDLLKSRY